MKKRKLNPKQAQFVRAYSNPKSPSFGNGSKSVQAAGYNTQTPDKGAHQLMRNSEIRSEITSVMDSLGATREEFGRVLFEGMNAHETKVFLNKKTGRLVYSKKLVDHANRLRAAELRARAGGDMPTNRTIERIESLRIQSTLIVVPGGMPEPGCILGQVWSVSVFAISFPFALDKPSTWHSRRCGLFRSGALG